MWYAEFRAWLETRMAERGLHSTSALAEFVGVASGTATTWRLGHMRPSRANCARLAEAFGRPAEEVLRACEYRARERPR
jgi:transcriptional regulator with XRE-family HTH domain